MPFNKILLFFIIFLCIGCKDSAIKTQDKNAKNSMPILQSAQDSAILAQQSNITMLVFVSDFCGACERLKEIMTDDSMRAVLKNYELNYVNVSDEKSQDLRARFSVVGTPTTIFLKDDKYIFGYPGFMGKRRLAAILEVLSQENTSDIMQEVLKKEREI